MWDLVPWPGIELRTPAFGAWSLSHWATREGRGSFNVDGQECFLWEVACGRDLEGCLGLWLAGRHRWKSVFQLRHGGAQEWPCRACPQDPMQSHTAASVTSMVPGQRRGRRTGKAHRGDAVEGCYKWVFSSLFKWQQWRKYFTYTFPSALSLSVMSDSLRPHGL